MTAIEHLRQPTEAVTRESGEFDRLLQQPAAIGIGFSDSASFELTQRVAKMWAASSLVPKDFQGNIANCAIALNLARRLGADELMVMQNLYIVHGRPGWSAQFLIATFNTCGRYSSLEYEFVGQPGSDDYGCRAIATRTKTNQRLTGETITIGLAKAEGWYGKQGSKWKSMPGQMLRYRAAAWFIRSYAPELSMGLHTADELADMDAEPEPATVRPIDALRRAAPSPAPRHDQQQQPATATAAPTEPATPPRQQQPEPRQQQPEPPPPADEWPRQEDGYWVDANGETYDPDQHGWSKENNRPSVTASGVFRAKRGAAKEDPPKAEPAPEPEKPTAQADEGADPFDDLE